MFQTTALALLRELRGKNALTGESKKQPNPNPLTSMQSNPSTAVNPFSITRPQQITSPNMSIGQPASANMSYENPSVLQSLRTKPSVSIDTAKNAASSVPVDTKNSPVQTGYTSTDPNVQARIKAMRDQTNAQSSLAPTTNNLNIIGSQTTPTINTASSYDEYQKALNKMREMSLGYMTPSEQEKQLQDQLANFQESARLGISNLEGQGRGIPLGLIRGQQGQLAEQAGIQEQTLLQKLANAQSEREANQRMAMAQLGYAEADIDRAISEQRYQDSLNQPISVNQGTSIIKLNPETGKYEAVYEGQSPDELLSVNEAAALGLPYGTTKSQAYGQNPKETLTGTAKIDLETKLSKQFLQTNKENIEAKKAIDNINSAYNEAVTKMNSGESINAVSQGVLVGFQKLIDPNSVVRESEYARSAQGLSILDYIDGFVTKLKQGGAGLTAESLKEFRDTATLFLRNYQQQQNDLVSLINQQADSYGLNINNIVSPGTLSTYQESIKAQKFNQLSPEIDYYEAVSNWGQDAVDQYLNSQGFTDDLSTSQKGSEKVQELVSEYDPGQKFGQCGRLVNEVTGLGVGNSYQSKISKTDPYITVPEPGDVFVMPYVDKNGNSYGHTGIVLGITPKQDGTFDLLVMDSNWGLDEKIQYHTLNSSKMTGYARPNYS